MLTDTKIRELKAGPKQVKYFDGHGLFLLCHPNGSKYWRLKYRNASKEKTLALGVYPFVTLKQAREKSEAARHAIAEGRDPSAERQAEKAPDADTFELVAREWFAKFSPRWALSHSEKIIRRLQRDVFPYLGSRPTNEITAPELLAVLRRIESRGATETAHRALQNVGQVLRYAVATGRAERNPGTDLKGALAPVEHHHYPAITDPKRIGELLRAICGYPGNPITCAALQIAPLVFTRPGELRKMEWQEVNLDTCEWRIPPEKMKSRALHVVPLSIQAVEILKQLQPLTGTGRYVFPGQGSSTRPMSENTVNKALRHLGYDKAMFTGHGFRGIASTILHEQGWENDLIEMQLAHGKRDKVRAAYDHADRLPERTHMMQAWADYLDGLRLGADVVTLKRA